MTRKEELVQTIMNKVAELKNSIDPDDKLSIEDYDIQYGDIEEVQYKVFEFYTRFIE